MKCLNHLSLGIFALVLLSNCSKPAEPPPEAPLIKSTDLRVADGIIYDVEILNPDPGNQWIEECLEGLDRERLVDWVFEGIHTGRFKTYDIFEGTEIALSEIRQMEADGLFKREQIGKFQFLEEWYIDPVDYTMSKRVSEIRMGIQDFDNEGFFSGYNPLFRVVL